MRPIRRQRETKDRRTVNANRTATLLNIYILPPQNMVSGRPRQKHPELNLNRRTSGFIFNMNPLYYLRGTLGIAALHLFKQCQRNS